MPTLNPQEKQRVAVIAETSLSTVYRYSDPQRRPRMHASVRNRIERAIRKVTGEREVRKAG